VVSREIVATKLAELAHRNLRLHSHRTATAAELEDDPDALELVSFNLMLAVQSCTDIASHIIADEGWRPATKLAEGFTRLFEHGVITQATARALRNAVGLRNVIAHGYAKVDPTVIHTASHEGSADLDAFAREITQWLAEVSND